MQNYLKFTKILPLKYSIISYKIRPHAYGGEAGKTRRRGSWLAGTSKLLPWQLQTNPKSNVCIRIRYEYSGYHRDSSTAKANRSK